MGNMRHVLGERIHATARLEEKLIEFDAIFLGTSNRHVTNRQHCGLTFLPRMVYSHLSQMTITPDLAHYTKVLSFMHFFSNQRSRPLL